MKIEQLVVGEMGTNCYLVWDEKSKEGIVIDPGDEGGFISEKILREGISLMVIVLTHGHFDHMMGALEIKLNFQVPIYLHKNDDVLYKSARNSAKHWLGRDIGPVASIDHFMKGGEEISFGEEKLTVRESPGHTRGSIYLVGERVIFTGDTLFKEGVGRTDFSYSKPLQLVKSVENIKKLKGFLAYPGHEEIFEI